MRKEILLAAQKLFQEKGLGNITMEDVAKSIGKGKSSLYYYFKSKDEIFAAVLDMEINDIVLETIKKLSKANSFRDKLESFGMTKFEMIKKRKSLYTAMEAGMNANEFERYRQFKREVHFNYLEKEKTLLQQIWIEAIENKSIAPMNSSSIEKNILLFLCSLRGINRESILTDNQDVAHSLIPSICDLFVKG